MIITITVIMMIIIIVVVIIIIIIPTPNHCVARLWGRGGSDKIW